MNPTDATPQADPPPASGAPEPDPQSVDAGTLPATQDPVPGEDPSETAPESDAPSADADDEGAQARDDGDTQPSEAVLAQSADGDEDELGSVDEPVTALDAAHADETQTREAGPAQDTAEAPTTAQAPPETVEEQQPGAPEPTQKPAAAQETTPPTPAADEAAAPAPAAVPEKPKKPKKPAGPDPAEVTRRIGKTNERALSYVLDPDPKLSRLSRKVREVLITDIPPVTAGALLGPAALARHFIASAAAGRYRDLFALWELFRARPDECKPVLAERQRALERARQALTTAALLGMAGGHSQRVAEDVSRAQGLIWTWLREILVANLAAVGQRPHVAAALLEREPELEVPLPADPDDRWLAEAAAVKQEGKLTPAMDEILSANVERLPATVESLSQVSEQYPERLEALVDRIDLESENIGALLAWCRDHGMGERVRARIVAQVGQAAAVGRAEGLAAWQAWRSRGVDLELPESLRAPTIEGLDLARPESADLIAVLIGQGADIDPQQELETLAQQNRQLAEKAYEAFVSARLDVHLPLALEGNPIVRDGTRCPACQAWTWVRPGHEQRCPRRQEQTTPAS